MRGYLQLKNLSVGYNGKSVVSNIDIDIKKGEIIALIGPNGAGKSTLLKTLSRGLDIINGDIILENKSLKEYSYEELSKKMAVILTERIRPELMTCKDIVATGRYPYTGRLGLLKKDDEEKIYNALSAVGGLDLADKDFNNISDGQRQRILLARAIAQEPQIILLDEPTSYLDIRYKLELLSILIKMAKKNNITVITSLHEIDLAQKIADRVITIGDNDTVEVGTPDNIFEEDKIKNLYHIDNGSYDTVFGSIEMQKPSGNEPKVFVITGGGEGYSVFRKLQREDIPFAAGILNENDVDYAIAKHLAAYIVSEKPFCEISSRSIDEAKQIIDRCSSVICTLKTIGGTNKRIAELIEYAEKEGKLCQR